jgi:hypothetical protein
VESSNPDVPVAFLMKAHQGSTYLFAVGMREGKTNATFTLAGSPASPAKLMSVDLSKGGNLCKASVRIRSNEVNEDRLNELDWISDSLSRAPLSGLQCSKR